MASVYQGKYTFPVASTAERSMQQAATAQAQMYAGLGKTFGDAIGKYFDAQDEKKAAESLADNQFANDIVYGPDRDVPADRNQRVKDMRGVIKASGGFKNFLGRIETERANQRADRAEALNKLTQERLLAASKQNEALGDLRIGALEDAAKTRKAGKELAAWMFKEKPGELPPTAKHEMAALRRFDPRSRQFPQATDLQPGQIVDPAAFVDVAKRRGALEAQRGPARSPAEKSSAELARYVAESDLSPEAKMAARGEIDRKRAEEIEDLKLRSALATARSTSGYKELEEERAARKAAQETTEFEQEQGQKDFSNLTIRDIDPSGNSIDVRLKGVVGNIPRADKLREDIGRYNDAQAKLDEMLKWAEVRNKPWTSMTFQEKDAAKRLSTMVQSAMREEVLGPGVVTDAEYVRLKEVIPNPAEFWSAKIVDPVLALKSLKRIARDSFMQKLKGFGVTPVKGSASSVSTAARPSGAARLPSGISGVVITEITEVGDQNVPPYPTMSPPDPGQVPLDKQTTMRRAIQLMMQKGWSKKDIEGHFTGANYSPAERAFAFEILDKMRSKQ